MPITLTRELAYSAGLDAANRSMQAAGRTAWNEEDANLAAREFNRLWPRCEHNIDPEDLCFYFDQEEIPAGHPLSTKSETT